MEAGSLSYRCARRLFLILARPMFGFRVEGAERIPGHGAGIVVAAHRSWLDPPCVGGACRRPIRFLILETIHAKPWMRWFYRAMGSIPVSSRASLGGVRQALRHLKGGGLVGVFPEGRVVRPDEVGRVYPGAALLAIRSRAPVIPVRIEGSAIAWPHGRWWPGPALVRVRVDLPILPPQAGPDALDGLVRRIESALAPRGGR